MDSSLLMYGAMAVGLVVLHLVVHYFLGWLDKAPMERPKILIEVGQELGLEFHPGSWSPLSSSHTTTYESARITGTHKGADVEVMLRCRGLKSGDAADGMTIKLHAKGFCAEAVVRARLPRIWSGVELMRWGFSMTDNEISGLDQPIGDENFDEEYVLTGRVDDELRRLLRIDEVQWAIEALHLDFIIRDGFVECPLGIGFTGEEIVENLDMLVDFVDIIEEASAEETRQHRQGVQYQ